MRALARASLTKNKGFDLCASEASTALLASGASYETHKPNGFDFCAQRSKHNIRWRFPEAERGKSSRQLSEADKANRRDGGWVCPRSVLQYEKTCFLRVAEITVFVLGFPEGREAVKPTEGWVCPRSVPKGASSEALRASPQGERKTYALECKNAHSRITTCLSHLISLHLLSQRYH